MALHERKKVRTSLPPFHEPPGGLGGKEKGRARRTKNIVRRGQGILGKRVRKRPSHTDSGMDQHIAASAAPHSGWRGRTNQGTHSKTREISNRNGGIRLSDTIGVLSSPGSERYI